MEYTHKEVKLGKIHAFSQGLRLAMTLEITGNKIFSNFKELL